MPEHGKRKLRTARVTQVRHSSAHGASPSPQKAREILRHGSVHGKTLTPKQKRFMGARAGGAPVKPKRK